MMTRTVLTLAFISTLAAGALRAQSPSQIAEQQTEARKSELSKGTIGLILDGSLNMHRANFQTLPDIPNCCPLFEDGSGWGGQFGLFYDFDAFGDGHLGVRATVGSLSGTLTAD